MKRTSSRDKENEVIHKKYRRNRLFVFGILIVLLLFITVAYSANLSSVLHMLGYVNLGVEEGNLEITSITLTSSTNATDNGTSMYIQEDSTDDLRTLVAEFDIDYYRSLGSSTMSATYDVVIENNTFRTQTLNTITSTPTFTSNTSTLSYTMSGANTGTTVLAPGESVTVTLVFSLGSSSRNTHYIVNEVFEFEFISSSNTNNIGLTAILDTKTVTFNTNDELKKIEVYLVNSSTNDITYNFSTTNSNFIFTDSNGNEITSLIIQAGTDETYTVYLKIADKRLFTTTTEIIDVSLNTTGPAILTYNLGKITATVPESGASKILQDKEIYSDSTIDFTSTVTSSGVFKNATSGELTYFYRGNVSNNYVSFAGFTWRIIRIDKYGTRIILDDVISDTVAWASSNTTSSQSLTEAISVLDYANSPVKTTLDSWYSSNLSAYSDVIESSLFCIDMSNQSMTSTGSGYTTYYFGSYIRNGKDSDGYTPEFVCDSNYIRTYDVGLISGDEVAFAGGLFNIGTTSYYLYNSNITSIWWTLSPSYYDTTLNTMGMLVVDGSTGKFYDWQDGNTIANSNAIRPVITLNTDRLSGGTGVVGNEYTFS